MAFPILAAVGLGLTGLGSVIQAKRQADNQRRMQEARRRTLAAEMQRQKGYQAEADAAMAKARQPFEQGGQQTRLDEVMAKRKQEATQPLPQQPDYEAPVQSSAPQVVRSEMRGAQEGALRAGRDEAERLAALRAWGDLFTGNQIGMNRAAGEMDMVSRFARGSAQINPLEVDDAMRRADKGPSTLGTILGTLGSAAGMAGLAGIGGTFGGGAALPAGYVSAGSFTGPIQNAPANWSYGLY